MIRRIGLLLIGVVAAFAAMYFPMGLLVKESPLSVIALAAATCTLPGIVVLIAAWQLRDKPAEIKLIAVLVTTAFRMAAAVGGGVLLYHAVPEVKEYVSPFISWGVVFYLTTLFVETRLLYIDTSGLASQDPQS